MSKAKSLAIFGCSDGLTACVGIVLACAARGQLSVLHAALGLLIAEGLGMAAAEWLSAETDTDWRGALVMGLATSLPIVLVAAPWLVLGAGAGLVGSCVVAVLLAALVATERAGGLRGWAETYAVLVGVALLAWGAGSL